MLGLAQHHAGIGRQGRKPGTGRRFPLPRFVGRMSPPFLRLVGLWQAFQQASIAVKRLGDILDIPQALTPSSESTAPARSSGTASPYVTENTYRRSTRTSTSLSRPIDTTCSWASRAAAKGKIGVCLLLRDQSTTSNGRSIPSSQCRATAP